MTIEIIKPVRQDVQALINQADSLMLSHYPPDSNHLDDLSELSKPNVCFVGAFVDQNLAGIGAVKTQSDDGVYGEIKRVYVDQNHRGQGLAQKIMCFLENYLIKNKIFVARLETGDKQTEAIGLYEKLGYKLRSPYGGYKQDPVSIFMEKNL